MLEVDANPNFVMWIVGIFRPASINGIESILSIRQVKLARDPDIIKQFAAPTDTETSDISTVMLL